MSFWELRATLRAVLTTSLVRGLRPDFKVKVRTGFGQKVGFSVGGWADDEVGSSRSSLMF